MDHRTTTRNGLTTVGWKKNNSVYAASNCDSSEPMSTVQRSSKDTQAKIAVSQPFFIDQYNKETCGVDRADQNIATYCIGMWWWEFVVWIPDMIVQNSWILYRSNKAPDDSYLNLHAFQREIVNVYLVKHALSRNQSGCLRGRILPAKQRVNDEVRYDWIDHYQSRFEKQKMCG